MLRTGILQPQINSLLSRVRHTNRLVIADRGFPFWPELETIDLALMDDVPTVLQVLRAVLANFQVGHVWMADEFFVHNPDQIAAFSSVLRGVRVEREAHTALKGRVPGSIGLIRTADTTPYSNIILESA